jgi:hypothetical protein
MKGHTGFVVTLLAAGLHSAVAGLPYQIDNDAHKSEPKLPGVYHTRTRHWGHGTAGPTIGYPGTAPSAGPTAVPGKPYPAWPHYPLPPNTEGETEHQPSYPHVPATGGWDKGEGHHEGEDGQHDGWGNDGKDHDGWAGGGGEKDHGDDECQDDGTPPPRPSKPYPKPTGAYPTMPVGTGGPHVPPIGDKPPQYATTLSTVSRGYGKPVQPTAPVMTAYS